MDIIKCLDCEKAQEQKIISYYKWKTAIIEMSGCAHHLRQVFRKLDNIQYRKSNEKKDSKER